MVYTVKQGDYLVKIAKQHGFASYRTVYDDPANAAFRKKRPNPDIIFPGDQIVIPDHEPRVESRPTDKRHTFHTMATSMPELRVVLQDGDGKPFAGKRYTLRMGRHVLGETDAHGRGETLRTGDDGLVKHAIDPQISQVTLIVFLDDSTDGVTYHLRVGTLDPIEEVAGVQARLANLGFPCARTGSVDEDTVVALQDFRRFAGISVPDAAASTIDSATRARLAKEHGS